MHCFKKAEHDRWSKIQWHVWYGQEHRWKVFEAPLTSLKIKAAQNVPPSTSTAQIMMEAMHRDLTQPILEGKAAAEVQKFRSSEVQKRKDKRQQESNEKCE